MKVQPGKIKGVVAHVESPWLTVAAAAEYLGVSREFIDALRYENGLTFYRLRHTVFVKKKDLDRMVERGRI